MSTAQPYVAHVAPRSQEYLHVSGCLCHHSWSPHVQAVRSPEDLATDWMSYQPVVMESSNPQIELSAYEKSRPGVSQTFWILYLRCSLQVCRLRSVRLTNLFLLAFFLLLLRVLLGEGGAFADVVMRLGIGQSMLMLPVCIHGLHIFNSDRLERQREDIAGIPTLSQYFAKDFCHLVELMLFAAVWTGASKGMCTLFVFFPLPVFSLEVQNS